MRWALKTITKKNRRRHVLQRKRMTSLKQQFEISERSGRKADPNEVSKLMRFAKDELGSRRFQPEDNKFKCWILLTTGSKEKASSQYNEQGKVGR